METKVCYLVDRNAAILAGEKFYGEVVVNVDPSVLSEAQRKELVLCEERNGCLHLNSLIDGKSLGGENAYWPTISKPSDEAPIQLLNARIEIREKRQREFNEAQKEKARLRKEAILFDSLVSANPDLYVCFTQDGYKELTEEARQAVCKYPNEHIQNLLKLRWGITCFNSDLDQNKRDEERRNQKALWLSLLSVIGQNDEAERFNADCLPQEERDNVASERLFKILENFPLYDPLCADDFAHKDQYCEGTVKFKGKTISSYNSEACIFTPGKFGYPTELTTEQFARVKKIAETIPEKISTKIFHSEGCTTAPDIIMDKVDIDVRVHTAFCTDCDGEIQRLGLRVTLHWNGSKFSKEFGLDAPIDVFNTDTDTDTDTEEDPYNPF